MLSVLLFPLIAFMQRNQSAVMRTPGHRRHGARNGLTGRPSPLGPLTVPRPSALRGSTSLGAGEDARFGTCGTEVNNFVRAIAAHRRRRRPPRRDAGYPGGVAPLTGTTRLDPAGGVAPRTSPLAAPVAAPPLAPGSVPPRPVADTPRLGAVSAPTATLDDVADLLRGRSGRRADRRGTVHRLRHPRLPRPGQPTPLPDDLRPVRLGTSCAATLLGTQPHRLAAGWGTREPNAGHRALAALERGGIVGRAHHPERRRSAPACGQPPGDRPARPDRRCGLPACRPSAAGRNCTSGWTNAIPASVPQHRSGSAPDGDVELEDTAGFRLVGVPVAAAGR